MKSLTAILAVSFVLGLVLMRVWIAVLGKMKLQQVIREDGPQEHLKKSGTLTMGGVAFFAAWLITVIAAVGFSDSRIRVVVIVSTVMFLIGLCDDLAKFFFKKTEGIKARYRLLLEIALGAILAWFMVWYGSDAALPAGMVWTPKWFHGVDLGPLFIPFVIFVFVGTVNSANLTDGLDGLLGGCHLIISAAFAYFVYKYSDRTLLTVLLAGMGAVTAFLWFNCNKASIFAGDAGSLFLGGLLASVAVVTRAEFFLLIVAAVLVAEAVSVILQVVSFKLTKKRIFKMAPLHHHFELSGWNETKVVTRFWIVTAGCSLLGLWMFIK